MLVEIVKKLQSLIKHKPYIASKGPGRWTIRHYDSVLRRWTDSGQTFFNKRDAELRLKHWQRRQAG